MRLTENVYLRHPLHPGPLGLQHGQCRRSTPPAFPRAGWFNHRGQFLGVGDLSHADLIIISERLQADELFLILDNDKAANLVRERPGTPDLMIEYATAVIACEVIFYVDRLGGQIHDFFDDFPPELPATNRRWIDRSGLWRMLQRYNAMAS